MMGGGPKGKGIGLKGKGKGWRGQRYIHNVCSNARDAKCAAIFSSCSLTAHHCDVDTWLNKEALMTSS